ncbi:MAG TPA: zinc ribbon domain-containing protein [Gemmatimonadales bacterium]
MPSPSRFCAQCGTGLSTGAAFCPSCGAAAGLPAATPGPNRTWVAAGIVITLSLLAIVWLVARRPPSAAAPTASPTAEGLSGPAPDISTLTARESFDRLFNRVMIAAEQGDRATASRLAEHGLSAYAQLDSIDLDARYHAAVLHAELREFAAALAIADTLSAQVPDHLLAWVIRGTVAELQGDQTALAAARRGFLAAWNADPKRDRPEYLDHQKSLDDFRASAGAP